MYNTMGNQGLIHTGFWRFFFKDGKPKLNHVLDT